MWKNYIKILKSSPSDRSDYLEYFLKCFPESCELLDKDALLSIINNKDAGLFYQQRNIENIFHTGNASAIISMFYYNNISWEKNGINLYLPFSNAEEFKKLDFISFDLELLLSKDSNNIILSLLFLFFLPGIKLKDLLFHYEKKIALLSCLNITQNNFEMLIYLIRKFDTETFKQGCNDYNYNHQLMGQFMENYIQKDTKVSKNLPLEKLLFLLQFNCGLKRLEEFRRNKQLFHVGTNLYQELIEIEVNFISEKISKQLKIKQSDGNHFIKI